MGLTPEVAMVGTEQSQARAEAREAQHVTVDVED